MSATIQVTTGEWPVKVEVGGDDGQGAVVPIGHARTFYLRDNTGNVVISEMVGEQGFAGPASEPNLPGNLAQAPQQAMGAQMPESGEPGGGKGGDAGGNAQEERRIQLANENGGDGKTDPGKGNEDGEGGSKGKKKS